MKLNKKKVLNFNKETLIKLHEKQMQALVGAGEPEMSNNPTIIVQPGEINNSCCKNSCNPPKNP